MEHIIIPSGIASRITSDILWANFKASFAKNEINYIPARGEFNYKIEYYTRMGLTLTDMADRLLNWRTNIIAERKTVPIEDVKKGEFFRIPGQKRVWIKGEYDRSYRMYSASAWDDISRFRHIKKGKHVEVDFTF